MSTIRADAWYSTNPKNPIYRTPIKITEVKIPYSTAAAAISGYRRLDEFSTGNTASLYSFTYTPARANSLIVYSAYLHSDRNSSGNWEVIVIFVNSSPKSVSYSYPRVQGSEPWHAKNQSGSYINTSTSNITFDIRCASGAGWGQSLGFAYSNTGQVMARTIQIMEFQR